MYHVCVCRKARQCFGHPCLVAAAQHMQSSSSMRTKPTPVQYTHQPVSDDSWKAAVTYSTHKQAMLDRTRE